MVLPSIPDERDIVSAVALFISKVGVLAGDGHLELRLDAGMSEGVTNQIDDVSMAGLGSTAEWAVSGVLVGELGWSVDVLGALLAFTDGGAGQDLVSE